MNWNKMLFGRTEPKGGKTNPHKQLWTEKKMMTYKEGDILSGGTFTEKNSQEH